MRALSLFAALLVTFSNSLASQQVTSSTSSTQAITLLTQSAAALTGTATISDVTLSRTARRICATFFEGSTEFIRRKLWGIANSSPFLHQGKFTTMREALLTRSGEALASRQAFEALSPYDRDCIIEFLKTLQVLPPQITSPVVDENSWPKMQSHGPN